MDDLTLRISTPGAATSAAKVAERLMGLGFTVVNVSPRGALVSAPRATIEKTFGARVVTDGLNTRFAGNVSYDKIGGGEGVNAYFPTPPTYFGR